jgi:hypothetical protein
MKRLALLAPFILTAALHAQKATVKAAVSMITFTWNYDYSVIPVCGGVVTTNCIHHFVLSEGSVAVTIAATTATSYQYNLTPLPTQGTHNYQMVAVETLTGSATISSAPAYVTVQVPGLPPTPANFTGTPQ